jgi:competence protein ComEA
VIETTARRDRRADETRTRLVGLMSQARTAHQEEPAELPVDQEWVDVSMEPPDPPPTEPWWRRGRVGSLTSDWAPDGPGRRRLAVAVIGGLVVVALVAVGVVVSSGGDEQEVPPVLPVAAAGESPQVAEKTIVVSVVGKVARPGLVTLPEGARVADALRETGGPVAEADLGALNLARLLADGEQIYVGVPPPPGAEPVAGVSAVPGVPGKVDLNSAPLAILDTLPGVGPVTAQRILDWRTEHGRFDSVEQLREIDGIGPSRYAKLQDLVVVR